MSLQEQTSSQHCVHCVPTISEGIDRKQTTMYYRSQGNRQVMAKKGWIHSKAALQATVSHILVTMQVYDGLMKQRAPVTTSKGVVLQPSPTHFTI